MSYDYGVRSKVSTLNTTVEQLQRKQDILTAQQAELARSFNELSAKLNSVAARVEELYQDRYPTVENTKPKFSLPSPRNMLEDRVQSKVDEIAEIERQIAEAPPAPAFHLPAPTEPPAVATEKAAVESAPSASRTESSPLCVAEVPQATERAAPAKAEASGAAVAAEPKPVLPTVPQDTAALPALRPSQPVPAEWAFGARALDEDMQELIQKFVDAEHALSQQTCDMAAVMKTMSSVAEGVPDAGNPAPDKAAGQAAPERAVVAARRSLLALE